MVRGAPGASRSDLGARPPANGCRRRADKVRVERRGAPASAACQRPRRAAAQGTPSSPSRNSRARRARVHPPPVPARSRSPQAQHRALDVVHCRRSTRLTRRTPASGTGASAPRRVEDDGAARHRAGRQGGGRHRAVAGRARRAHMIDAASAGAVCRWSRARAAPSRSSTQAGAGHRAWCGREPGPASELVPCATLRLHTHGRNSQIVWFLAAEYFSFGARGGVRVFSHL